VEGNNGDTQDDKQLVAMVMRGDHNAFGTIIHNTERLVASIIFKMIQNAEDRKDIAQDVYLKAFRKLSSFRFESKLSTWIGHIAYTTCLDQLKKKKLSLILDDENNNEEKITEALSMQNERSLQKDLKQVLHLGINELPPLYRTLITLYHTEELSYEEIMRIMDLPEGTVKNYLFRARKMLRSILLEQYKKEDL
jgi:RNA polymerase sigma factor (sigma-70 family)